MEEFVFRVTDLYKTSPGILAETLRNVASSPKINRLAKKLSDVPVQGTIAYVTAYTLAKDMALFQFFQLLSHEEGFGEVTEQNVEKVLSEVTARHGPFRITAIEPIFEEGERRDLLEIPWQVTIRTKCEETVNSP